MTEITWQEAANRLIARYGYVVITSCTKHEPGTVLKDLVIMDTATMHPWVVIGSATEEEYREHCAVNGQTGDSPFPYFHKVVTD